MKRAEDRAEGTFALRSFVVGIVCLLLVALASPVSGQDAVSESDRILEGHESSHPEVIAYADYYDVSTDRAADILRMQEQLNVLAGRLSVEFPKLFAGAEFVNGKDFAFHINTTIETPEMSRAIEDYLKVAGIPTELVSTRDAAYSAVDQLARIAEFNEAARAIADLPPLSVSIDPLTGDIIAFTADPDGVSSRLAPSTKAAFGLRIEETGGMPVETACPHHNGWLEGGRRMMMTWGSVPPDCGGSASVCTSGFTIMVDGYQGVLTAGHCAGSSASHWGVIQYADGDTDFTDTVFRRHVTCCFADAQANREKWASSQAYPRIYLYNQIWRTINTVAPYTSDDTFLCAKGGNTAEALGHQNAVMCGNVTHENYDPDGPFGGKLSLGWFQLELTSNANWRGGDSGGPVYIGLTGHGIGTHCTPSGSGCSRYIQVNKLNLALSKVGATLFSG